MSAIFDIASSCIQKACIVQANIFFALLLAIFEIKYSLALAIQTSVISNNSLSRSEILVPVLT